MHDWQQYQESPTHLFRCKGITCTRHLPRPLFSLWGHILYTVLSLSSSPLRGFHTIARPHTLMLFLRPQHICWTSHHGSLHAELRSQRLKALLESRTISYPSHLPSLPRPHHNTLSFTETDLDCSRKSCVQHLQVLQHLLIAAFPPLASQRSPTKPKTPHPLKQNLLLTTLYTKHDLTCCPSKYWEDTRVHQGSSPARSLDVYRGSLKTWLFTTNVNSFKTKSRLQHVLLKTRKKQWIGFQRERKKNESDSVANGKDWNRIWNRFFWTCNIYGDFDIYTL